MSGNTYQIVTIPPNFTWQQARDSSTALGGHLATTADQSEMDFLLNLLGSANVKPVWLGGWEPTEGGWEWVTNEPFNYTNWCGGEPNEAFAGEDFISVGTGGTTCWNDSRNWFTVDGLFIVEFELCCESSGSANGDSNVGIADVTFIIARIFAGGPTPDCNDEADADGNNTVNIADITYLIARIFAGGPPPVCGTTGT